MTAIFLSDVHLRDCDSVKTKLVIRFLQEVASRFERIFVLGDLFDVWPGTTNYLIKRFDPVISTLRGLVSDGHEVTYLEGNHDFRLGKYFSQELGIRVFPDAHSEQFGDKRAYLAHGDLGNPKDLGYRCLRYVLRRNMLHQALRAFPEDLIFRVGLKSSQMSRKYQQRSPKIDTQIRQTYRRTAEQIFQEGFDVVIMGHTHLPDDVTTLVGSRSCRYINLGDWVSHFTYLEFDGSQFYTKTHPVKDH